MPANLPQPIYQTSDSGRGWLEQLMLTLASQGPSTLMQWLEHRQAGQQRQAVDMAAQGALQAMAPTMNAGEQAAVRGAGGQVSTVERAPTVQGQRTASGINVPTVAPMHADNVPLTTANFSGLKPGVAPALLEMLQGIRTNTAAQDASKATTTATLGRERREQALHPGELELQAGARDVQRENILTSQDTRATNATTRQLNALQGRLAESRERREANMAKYQADLIVAQIANTNVNTIEADRRLNQMVSSDVQEHRREFQNMYTALSGTLVGASPEQVRAQASKIVFDTDVPPTDAELRQHYRDVIQNGAAPDLYETIKERTMASFGVTPEQYQRIMQTLAQNDGDPQAALRAARAAGASAVAIRNAAAIYSIETSQPVSLPDDRAGGRAAGAPIAGRASLESKLATLKEQRAALEGKTTSPAGVFREGTAETLGVQPSPASQRATLDRQIRDLEAQLARLSP